MKHILMFIFYKLTGKDFWLLALSSAVMYLGWQTRSTMRENIWKSYKSGHMHSSKTPF